MPAKDQFDYSTKILYSKQRSMVDFTIRPDSILTPLLYAFNQSLEKNKQVCIGDMPMLVQRERLANAFKLDTLREIFEETLKEWSDNSNFDFCPEIKYAE